MAENNAQEERRLIVCIEDDPDTLQYVRLALRNPAYNFVGVTNPAEGLDIMRRRPPDCVLLDIMMPDMNGWEVYRRMRAEASLKNVPVIVITARAGQVDKVFGEQVAKVDQFIVKPFTPEQIRAAVSKALT